MKAAGSKFVNNVLTSKRCARHDVKAGIKGAKRSKVKNEWRREIAGGI